MARLLGVNGPETLRIGGSIAFEVTGAGGGMWVVNLSVPGGLWTCGEAEALARASTRVRVTARSFALVLTDPDAFERAELRDAIAVSGDLARWRELLARLRAAGPLVAAGPLSARRRGGTRGRGTRRH